MQTISKNPLIATFQLPSAAFFLIWDSLKMLYKEMGYTIVPLFVQCKQKQSQRKTVARQLFSDKIDH